MQSALISSLQNKQVSQRTLWFNVDKLEEIMGGIKVNFGDDFKFIKVNVEAVNVEEAKLSVTSEHGIVIELKNKFMFENPRVTLAQGDAEGSEDEDDDIPFMEIEITHKLHSNLSQYTSEVIDFTISSIEAKMVNYGIYYQSETELPDDEEARENLLNFVVEKYIQDVNSVQN